MKKIFLIFILVFQIALLASCSQNEELDLIGDQYIFTIEQDDYLIYFHRDGCSGCELVYPVIIDYLNEARKEKEYLNIYSVNLHPEDSGEKQSSIFREFSLGNTGQGKDGTFYVDGVTTWTYLYIAATPSLIRITKEDDVKKAHFIAQGATDIETYLNSLLGE